MIDQTCCARLADFGLLTVVPDSANFFSSSTHAQGGTLRWMGPELIAPEKFGIKTSRPTKSSDCYSLGMVVYETVSGNIPFYQVPDPAIFIKVVEGERPSRGVGFTDDLWKVMEQCWMPHPSRRPSVEGVLGYLERLLIGGDLGLDSLISAPAGNTENPHVWPPLVNASQEMRVSGRTPPVVLLDNRSGNSVSLFSIRSSPLLIFSAFLSLGSSGIGYEN